MSHNLYFEFLYSSYGDEQSFNNTNLYTASLTVVNNFYDANDTFFIVLVGINKDEIFLLITSVRFFLCSFIYALNS